MGELEFAIEPQTAQLKRIPLDFRFKHHDLKCSLDLDLPKGVAAAKLGRMRQFVAGNAAQSRFVWPIWH